MPFALSSKDYDSVEDRDKHEDIGYHSALNPAFIQGENHREGFSFSLATRRRKKLRETSEYANEFFSNWPSVNRKTP